MNKDKPLSFQSAFYNSEKPVLTAFNVASTGFFVVLLVGVLTRFLTHDDINRSFLKIEVSETLLYQPWSRVKMC